MLVLTRKQDEFIRIGSDIVIRVMKTSKGTVKLGIDAPASVRVMRGEVLTALKNAATSDFDTDDFKPAYEILSLEPVFVEN